MIESAIAFEAPILQGQKLLAKGNNLAGNLSGGDSDTAKLYMTAGMIDERHYRRYC